MAERFNDSSYIALMRKCYESSNSYLREAQEKSEQANRCYDRYMQLRAEVEYRRNEASRLNDNIQKECIITDIKKESVSSEISCYICK